MSQEVSYHYWAYIPNPPLVHAVSWGESEVPVCTNVSAFFPPPNCGGIQDIPSHRDPQIINGSYVIGVEGDPICFGQNRFCLPLYHRNH